MLASKAGVIERAVARVRETYIGHEAGFLTDYDCQDICVLNFQRACEAAIDMANRVVKLRRLGFPEDSKESFRPSFPQVLSNLGHRGHLGADGRLS